jgi:hypothetical protein
MNSPKLNPEALVLPSHIPGTELSDFFTLLNSFLEKVYNENPQR